jgi:endoglycosylceramidase
MSKWFLFVACISTSHFVESNEVFSSSIHSLRKVFVVNRTFVDDLGRERHFRGINVVYKDPPYFPSINMFDSNLSFVATDADFLESLGVNLVRLGVMWPGVFPLEKDRADLSYLGNIRKIIRLCADHGIYVIIEPHQDELHPMFCGEGVPDWLAKELFDVDDFPVPLQACGVYDFLFHIRHEERHIFVNHATFGFQKLSAF